MGRDLTLSSEGKDFPVYLADPKTEAKGAVIVIHEVWGLADHIKDICDRLAKEGFVALAPNLMSETGIEELVSDDLVKDLFDPEKRSAIQPKLRAIMAPIQAPDYAEGARLKLKECYKYLSKNSVTGDKIAVMGFCFGGTYSFETAMIEPELKAAVPFYGHAAFSVDQLKAIKCPILAFYGEKDENLISQLPEVDANMKKAGVNFRKVVYPGCGHAFFNDTNPYTYNADAAKDAWQKTLAFLSSSFQD